VKKHIAMTMKIPTIKPIPVNYAFHIIASSCLMLAISEQILDFHRTGGSITTYVLITTLLVSLVFFTRSLLSSNLRKKRKEAAWSAVWSKIKAESNLAKALSMLLFALTQSIVLLIVYVATISLVSNSARCLTMALASAGNYEASEQLYKFSNPSTQTSLISFWDYPYQRNRGEQLVNIEQKTSAVTSVYGSKSLELADYYAFLAEEYLQRALYLNKHQTAQRATLFERSQLFGKRALQISSNHRNNTECSVALGVIAVNQMSLGKISEARHTVAKAVDLLVKSEASARKDWASGDLGDVANKIGDLELVKQIKIAAASRPNYTAESRRKGFLDATTIAIAMPIIALIFLLKAWERSILTLIFRKKWILELKQAEDEIDTLAALDKLTTLELYKGRTIEADIYSQAMLQTALEDA
jgi:DNA-directed RNA polymerase subunit K/omega